MKKNKGKSLILDKNAKSSSKDLPAFLSRPKDSQIYHGFPLVEEINKEGFIYGAITDFLEFDSDEGCTEGDGYVVAPDGSRAGIVWEKGDGFSHYKILDFEKDRWGVYGFIIPFGIKSTKDMKEAFFLMLPILKEYYKKSKSN